MDVIKKDLGYYVVNKFVKSGMKIGLGTGSTARFAIERLSTLIMEQALKDVVIVPTSEQTEIELQKCRIPYFSLNYVGVLDLAIDGADQVDLSKRVLCKGGGAALFREKMVAYNSKDFVVFLGEEKVVQSLGQTFPLPVEVSKFNFVNVEKNLLKIGFQSVNLRIAKMKAGPVITESGNYILDCLHSDEINDLKSLEKEIKSILGVIESGIFSRDIKSILIGSKDGIKEF